jgi:hypothetical protein
LKEVILGEVFVDYDQSSNSLVFLANREVVPIARKSVALKAGTPANKIGKSLEKSTNQPDPKMSMPNIKR